MPKRSSPCRISVWEVAHQVTLSALSPWVNDSFFMEICIRVVRISMFWFWLLFRAHKGQLGAPQGASCELNFNGFLKNLPLGTLIFLSSGFILDWILIHFKYLCMVACMYWSVQFLFLFFSFHLVSGSVYVIWVLMFFAFSIWLMCLEV